MTSSSTTTFTSSFQESSTGILIGAILGAIALIFVSLSLIVLIQRIRAHHQKRGKLSIKQTGRKDFIETKSSMSDKNAEKNKRNNFTPSATSTIHVSSFGSNNLPVFIPGYRRLHEDQFEMGEDLGKGGTATVSKATVKDSKLIDLIGKTTKVAIKYFSNHSETAFKFEVALMGSLPESEYIVKFFGYMEDPMAIVMKLYFCPLRDLIMNPKYELPLESCFQITLDIAFGIEHLHRYDLVHFDMKPLNILVEILSDDQILCVISDLGSCKIVGTDLTSINDRVIKGLEQPEKAHVTISYASPEFIKLFGVKKKNCLPIHKMIDIYAFGITMLEILKGDKAWTYNSVKEFRDFVLMGGRPEIPSKLKELALEEPSVGTYIDLLQCCWHQVPEQRPTISRIIDIVKTLKKKDRNQKASIRASPDNTLE